MSESIVLCEGYHDRAFWAAWLERLECTDPGKQKGGGGRRDVLDPWGNKVVGGQYAFHSGSGRFVRIVPCNGKSNVLPAARIRLQKEADRLNQGASESRLTRLVVNLDPDVSSSDPSGKTGFRQPDLRALLTSFDSSPVETDDGDFKLLDARITVSLVRWETENDSGAGLPDPQTLERLVCAALVAAYPERGLAVQNWINSRPGDPAAGPKEFAWSYMAGWYAENGCEAFYRQVWKDDGVVGELEPRLRACGAWRIARALAE